MNVLINVKGVQGINQNKLIKFLQGQNANAVKRHLNALMNRKNISQKKAYVNAQLENLFTPRPPNKPRGPNSSPIRRNTKMNQLVSKLQEAGLILNKNYTKNQLRKNENRIGRLGNKLESVGLFKNPYLKLLFTRTNNMERELGKNNNGKSLKNFISRAQAARQAFMARNFIRGGGPRIPQTSMATAFQQSINLNKRIRTYFGLGPNSNLTHITSKPDFVKFLNNRGPKRNGDTLNNVHRKYVQKNLSKMFNKSNEQKLRNLGLNEQTVKFFKTMYVNKGRPINILNKSNMTPNQKKNALLQLKQAAGRAATTIMFGR